MADQLRTALQVELQGNVERRAERWQRSMRQFSERGQRYMSRLGRGVSYASRRVDMLGNAWTALGAGGGLGLAARQVVRFEDRLTNLGASARASREQIEELEAEIFRVASRQDVAVSPERLTAAVEQIVEKTGDLRFAERNLETLGRAIQAVDARGQDIGLLAAELQKGGQAPDEVLRSLETLVVQGEKAGFTMNKLAGEFPKLLAAYRALGRTGPEAVAELGGALQGAMKGISEAPQTAEAMESVLTELQQPRVVEQLERAGIAVRNAEGEYRSIADLMAEIASKANGMEDITRLFGEEARRAFNYIMQNEQALEEMQGLAAVSGDSERIMERATRNAATAASQMERLTNALKELANSGLAQPIEDLATAINSLDTETLRRIGQIGVGGGLGLAGLWAANKAVRTGVGAWRLGRRVLGRSGGAAGSGGVAGGVAAATGVQPVYVVNMPGRRQRRFGDLGQRSQRSGRGPSRRGTSTGRSSGRTARQSARSARSAASRGASWAARTWRSVSGNLSRVASRLAPHAGKLAKLGGRTSLLGTAFWGGWEIGSLINDKLIDGTKMGDQIGLAVAHALSAFPNPWQEDARLILEVESSEGARAQVKQMEGGPQVEVESREQVWRAP